SLPVGDVAVRGEQDRLVVAGTPDLHRREHRVEVDSGRLRDVRNNVRADALPVRDLAADAVALPLLAEIRAPRPREDRDVDRVPDRGDSELAVADERDRPDVAGRETVDSDQVPAGGTQLVTSVRELHRE